MSGNLTASAPFHDAVTGEATQGGSYGTGATSDYSSGATSTGMDNTESTGYDNTQAAGMSNTRDMGTDNTQSTSTGTSNTQIADLDNDMKPSTTAIDTTGLPSELATARTIGAKEAEDKAYSENFEGKDSMDAHLSSISGPSGQNKDVMDGYMGKETNPEPVAPAVSLDHLPSHETMAKLEKEVRYDGPGKNEKYY